MPVNPIADAIKLREPAGDPRLGAVVRERPVKAQRAGKPHSAAVIAMAALVSLSGCASPFRFSPLLDTHRPAPGGPPPPALAGNLHLALAALQDQRRQLWEAAGETEMMKNATALGLIGLGSAAIYRGLRGDESRGWLERAGLLASATYAGATWLEPSARQKVYLAGAMSLTCLALTTAPYEMTLDDYQRLRQEVAKARGGVERLASVLRLVGRYSYRSDTHFAVRGGWNKLRWAQRVLESADNALGNIEAVGPRLRDLTALTTSEVARQIDGLSRNLSQIDSVLAQLKPKANVLMGSEVFALPDKDSIKAEAPGAPGPDPTTDSKSDGRSDDSCRQTASPAASPPATTASSPAPTPVETAQRASEAARRQARDAEQRAAEAAALPGLLTELRRAMADIDGNLGPVASFVQRVSSSRQGLRLPDACGTTTVSLVPSTRDLQLQPGESFQFLLTGDVGRASAEILSTVPGSPVLDVSMPMTQSSSAIRLSAAHKVATAVNTVVRISDSKGQQTFDVTVKVCAGIAP